jgi:hypothetical protein
VYNLRDFADYTFYDHYRCEYKPTDQPYSYYEPAYRYGYDLAFGYPYRNRGWRAIEADARRDWERRYPRRNWEDFKEAVRFAWERVKQTSSYKAPELQ